MRLEDLLARLSTLPEDQRREAEKLAQQATSGMRWIPSPGPQTDAYFSKADILLFGGQPGGGKTALLIGVALNLHERSLIVRRAFTDLEGVIDNAKGMLGTSDGFVHGSRPKYTKQDGSGVIHFQGMAEGNGGFDDSKQGTPHDFIGVDEGAQLGENAVRMLLGWNRTIKPGQRCRMIIASNPPLDSTGDWMIEFFGPWLNPNHPRPAVSGELRWFITDEEGKSKEVPEGTESSHSRTFIPSGLEDNPFLDAKDYRKRLNAMPEPYRSILISGNFMYARKDADFQVIPTAWVQAAQERWDPNGWKGKAMTAMACDPAGGGRDSEVLAWRYGGWYAPLVDEKIDHGSIGNAAAGKIVQHRKNEAPVVVDVGGGYGGPVCMRLKDNGIAHVGFNGASASKAKTKDGKLTFVNKRAEAWWKFREELDPDQEGGSAIALPPDAELRADLTAPTWTLRTNGILIEAKEDIRKRLGRSPGRGDAVVMALSEGHLAAQRAANRRSYADGSPGGRMPKVVMGYQASRSLLRR